MHRQSTLPSSAPSAVEYELADRSLAVAAYLGYLVGLWLIAPIAVYLLRRRRSRFVAFHAAQAILLHLLFGALLTVCGLFATLVGAIAVFVFGASSTFGVEFFLVLGWGSWLAPTAIHVALTAISAWLAHRGRVDPASRLGRMTLRLLSHDPGLPPPAEA
jgi:uncharacterized membrane protein